MKAYSMQQLENKDKYSLARRGENRQAPVWNTPMHNAYGRSHDRDERKDKELVLPECTNYIFLGT
jgi:hypothetical protein